MKITLKVSCPYVLSSVPKIPDLSSEDGIVLGKLLDKFFDWEKDYITLEFDTEAGTCVVLPVQ